MSETIKITLFGPESTGKTWLAERLAEHFKTVWVAEYARTYLESKKKYYNFYASGSEEICLQEDILPIVMGQITIEDLQLKSASRLMFLDTNPLQTKIYVNYYYKSEYNWLLKILEERHYDFYLLTNIDIEWQPDELRDRPNDRNGLFQLFESELKHRNLDYAVIEGSDEIRLKNAIEAIEKFLEKINSR